MQAFEEVLYLLLDRVRHLVLRHELNVLVFVFVGYGQSSALRLEVDHFDLPQLVAFCGEGELDDICDVMIQHPFQIGEVFRIKCFQISRNHLLPQHVLVEASGEPSLQVLAIMNGLANHPSNEVEKLEVVSIDIGHRIRVVGASLATGLHKEGIVGVKNFPGQRSIPLLGHTSGIDALFALELNLDLGPHLLTGPYPELVVRVHENLISTDS
mmetsp:Transcript_82736/g.198528  ORF Transcript_82736/g.198528 Transcript_82736/m.198528 type:complete len:212 (-) Transcript_82736:983-1618(-)